jgi:hypothetical protein
MFMSIVCNGIFLTLCKYMYKECTKELEERFHTSVYWGY